MYKYVSLFFEIASWISALLIIGSSLFIIISLISLINKRSMIKSIIELIILCGVLTTGLKLYLADVEQHEQNKILNSQISSTIGSRVERSEKISHQSRGKILDFKIKIFGKKLPSGKDCELRTVQIEERYAGGMLGEIQTVKSVSAPLDCSSSAELTVAPKPTPAQIKQGPIANTSKPSPILHGDVTFQIEGAVSTYTMIRLNSSEAPKVMAVIITRPANTTEHNGTSLQLNNPAFREVNIISGGQGVLNSNTTLLINGLEVLKRDGYSDDGQLESVGELPNDDKAILLSTFSGGNSCDSQQQAIVIQTKQGYVATPAFGRCQPSIYQGEEKDLVYFFYSPNEYHPAEIFALYNRRG